MSVSLSNSSSPRNSESIPLLKTCGGRNAANGLLLKKNEEPKNLYTAGVEGVFKKLFDWTYGNRIPTRSRKDKIKIRALAAFSYAFVGAALPLSLKGAAQKVKQVYQQKFPPKASHL